MRKEASAGSRWWSWWCSLRSLTPYCLSESKATWCSDAVMRVRPLTSSAQFDVLLSRAPAVNPGGRNADESGSLPHRIQKWQTHTRCTGRHVGPRASMSQSESVVLRRGSRVSWADGCRVYREGEKSFWTNIGRMVLEGSEWYLTGREGHMSGIRSCKREHA